MAFVGQNIDISTDNFGTLVRNNCLLVDKTLMIKEFLEGPTVSLITRPRRFGKTITLSMLQHFLSPNVSGIPTAGLFDQLLIAKENNGEFLKKHQGQYPVIFISFKDAKKPSYEETVAHIRGLIKQLYWEHSASTASLGAQEKHMFERYQAGDVTEIELQAALAFLSAVLFNVHGKKAYIFIDEYDSPLTNAYQHTPENLVSAEEGFLYQLSNFMRDLFSPALKTNSYLEKGLMTGILRVSKNNMLSGLNNLKVYTVLDEKYYQYFGFTQEEVDELIQAKRSTETVFDIKAFYNGYFIGEKIIYNPWSFMNYLDEKRLAPYWIMTSNDRILRDQFIGSNAETKQVLKTLMLGETITGEINTNLRYEDLMEKPEALWTLLLFCGYLTSTSYKIRFSRKSCQLKIPNLEIMDQYSEIFSDWLRDHLGQSRYDALLNSLLIGDVKMFISSLSDYLMASLSFHDIVGKKYEKFYHGFVLGLIASIRDTHHVDSNKESGKGLFDAMITPKDTRYNTGVVIEFKYSPREELLKDDALAALQQIDERQYDTTLKQSSFVKQRVKIGIAFCDKAVIAAYKHNDDHIISWSDLLQRDDEE